MPKTNTMPVADQPLKAKFFEAMSFAACTVNVVTTDGSSGKSGVTVSAMSSVSADTPNPTLLVCVHEQSAAAGQIVNNGVFCVNVLRDHQSYISDVFAGRYNDKIDDKFDCAEWVADENGVPRLVGALVSFSCRIVSTTKMGTHFVIFGEVEELKVADSGSALIYANRAYGTNAPIETTQIESTQGEEDKATLSIGCFHTFGPYVLPELIKELKAEHPAVSFKLVEGENRRIKQALLAGEVEMALMYDYDLSPEIEAITLTELEPYVLLAEGHHLASKEYIYPEDLAEEPMISVEEETSRKQLEGLLRAQGIEPKVFVRSSSFEMVRGMVACGLGFAILLTKPGDSMSYDGTSLVGRRLMVESAPIKVVLAQKRQEVSTEIAAKAIIVIQRQYGLVIHR
jgi:flavin reductase (DIM6/NTAB) family NADH-FMN oxidoreductase RutF/DNA-binding transcriptional LysR family regulator